MSSVADLIPPAVTSLIEFPTAATLNFDADPAVAFLPRNASGDQVENFAWYPENQTSQTYEFTLQAGTTGDGVTFSETPIDWIIYPGMHDDPPQRPTHTIDGDTISFTLPRPLHFRPWMFRFAVDFGGVTAIKSQAFFIGRPTGGRTFDLTYDPTNGVFGLVNPNNSSVALILISQLVLIHLVPGEFTVHLQTINSEEEASFSATPILWSSGSQPDWIDVNVPPGSTDLVEIGITSGGKGKAEGFRFSIDFNGVAGILSPDPIIVNASIGDGTGGFS